MSEQKGKKRKLEEDVEEKEETKSDNDENGIEEVDLKGGESEESGEDDEDDDDDDEDDDDEEESEEEEEEEVVKKSSNKDTKKKKHPGPRTFLPGGHVKVHGGMYCDESAYTIYHRADIGYSCLSCDIIHDKLGDDRTTFPATCYIAAGTQDSNNNNIIVMKMSNLHIVKSKDADDDDEDGSECSYDGDADWDEEEEEEEGSKRRTIKMSMLKHPGAVNRIRTVNIQDTTLAATWSDTGKVYIWSLMESLKSLDRPSKGKKKEQKSRSLFCFDGHKSEGFAMDWNALVDGGLATGDCEGGLHTWCMTSEGSWRVAHRGLVGHGASVEDVQWSPVEANVLASCSVDKTIRVWDVRCDPAKACKLTIDKAHDSDVNVISWNRLNSKFIASGGDDGVIKIWDLTMFKNSSLSSSAHFKHHTAPITSLHWSPHDSSVLVASGEDDQVSVWDVAMEAVVDGSHGNKCNNSAAAAAAAAASGGGERNSSSGNKGDKSSSNDNDKEEEEEDDVLPQLLFVHRGQQEVKEVRWHPQVPGLLVSTAIDGLNVFKTANL